MIQMTTAKHPEITEQELINILLSIPAENRTTEFKRLGKESDVKRIMQSIVAMTNTDGGIIIFGIDDPEKSKLKGLDRIFGIEENSEKFDEIGKNLERIVPPTLIQWPPLGIKCDNNKTIAVLLIPKSEDSFHSIKNHVYIRLEKGNKPLTPHEIITLSYAKGFQHADTELVDIDFDLLKTEYFDKWRKTREIPAGEISEILYQTGLARKDDKGVLKITRAAVLLFALFPNDLMETKCTIRVSQYMGTRKQIKNETLNLIGTPKTIGGPIIKQIKDAHDYVLTLLRAGMRMPLSGFVTTYRIPERAVKEAITNAVIHRDYFQKRDIEVRIFEDRVEIESPGLFPSNITVFNIGYTRSASYRNDLLVKHLREFPDPPNLDMNEGVKAMRVDMDRSNLYPPVFLTYPLLKDSVSVVLINSIRHTNWDKVYYYLLNREKYVNNEKVREITGNPDTSKVSKFLKKWVEHGLLIKIETGSKKTVKYRLPIDIGNEFLFAKGKANKK